MKLSAETYRLKSSAKIDLAKTPTRGEPLAATKEAYADAMATNAKTLDALQRRFYASGTHAFLLVFQGLDAAGKDGAIGHVLTGVNPQGCQVTSFKRPNAGEFAHDFLWRAARATPARGIIGVFNRSYYESVLITRVHPELLREEGFDRPPADLDAFFAERRVSIHNFERHLDSCRTKIVKIFLHVSPEEQRRRLVERLDDQDKNWKLGLADIQERSRIKDYWRAYEDAFAATDRPHARWHVVPADEKRDARLIVAQIVIEALQGLDLRPPSVDAARRRELEEIRGALKA